MTPDGVMPAFWKALFIRIILTRISRFHRESWRRKLYAQLETEDRHELRGIQLPDYREQRVARTRLLACQPVISCRRRGKPLCPFLGTVWDQR